MTTKTSKLAALGQLAEDAANRADSGNLQPGDRLAWLRLSRWAARMIARLILQGVGNGKDS